jgi:hypothetical protein
MTEDRGQISENRWQGSEWSDIRSQRPEVSEVGKEELFEFGIGNAKIRKEMRYTSLPV